MHGLDKSGDIAAFGFGATKRMVGGPRVPAVYIVNLFPGACGWQTYYTIFLARLPILGHCFVASLRYLGHLLLYFAYRVHRGGAGRQEVAERSQCVECV